MIYSFSKQNGGGGGADATMRASGFTQSELSGSSLVFKNLSGTEVGSVELSGLTPSEVTELNAVSAVPVSGAAGSVIALNKPETYEWITFSAAVQTNWTKIRGLCSESTWVNLNFSPSGTWTRIGNYDGNEWINGEFFLNGFTITYDGANFTATNGSMNATGTTDGTTWEIDFDNVVIEVQADWEIPSNDEIEVLHPQEIAIYQANSGGTYVNYEKDIIDNAYMVKAFPYAIGPHYFQTGDVISLSDGRIIYSNTNQTGLNSFKEVAYTDNITVGAASGQNNLTIWRGSQQDYDAITTKDSDTMYVII